MHNVIFQSLFVTLQVLDHKCCHSSKENILNLGVAFDNKKQSLFLQTFKFTNKTNNLDLIRSTLTQVGICVCQVNVPNNQQFSTLKHLSAKQRQFKQMHTKTKVVPNTFSDSVKDPIISRIAFEKHIPKIYTTYIVNNPSRHFEITQNSIRQKMAVYRGIILDLTNENHRQIQKYAGFCNVKHFEYQSLLQKCHLAHLEQFKLCLQTVLAQFQQLKYLHSCNNFSTIDKNEYIYLNIYIGIKGHLYVYFLQLIKTQHIEVRKQQSQLKIL
eukprot:TRINITY_DN217_c0_g1_i1.p1 TRINITY_DN217_c0_g1~~TRINITY_DN217_c0_g1_i1.p1  ORF type:complete len:270 (-),score=-13.97 TRINITY_DN217_c0_g1_i1:1759-2568(-)